jgi:hypothetical protein
MTSSVEMKNLNSSPKLQQQTPTCITKVKQLASMDTSFFGDRLTADLKVVSFFDFYLGKIKAFFSGDPSHLLYDSKKIEAAVAKFFHTNMKTLVTTTEMIEADKQNVAKNIKALGISQRVSTLADHLNFLSSSMADPAAQERIGSIYRLEQADEEIQVEKKSPEEKAFKKIVEEQAQKGMTYNFETGKFE